MKKGIVIISLILLGITVFRLWRIQDARPLSGVGKTSVETFSTSSPIHKWAETPTAPALNAAFGIVPEKDTDKGKEEKSKKSRQNKEKQNKSKNAGGKKSLPQVFGVFSEEGKRYALVQQQQTEKKKKKGEKGGQSNKQSQPGYLVIPEGGAVESFLLAEILPTRLLFKMEGEDDLFVTLFQYDEKAMKGEETGNDNEGDFGKSKSTGGKTKKAPAKSSKSSEK